MISPFSKLVLNLIFIFLSAVDIAFLPYLHRLAVGPTTYTEPMTRFEAELKDGAHLSCRNYERQIDGLANVKGDQIHIISNSSPCTDPLHSQVPDSYHHRKDSFHI